MTTCSNCGEQTPCDDGAMTVNGEKPLLPHNGFCLDLTGHYGGFTDDIDGTLAFVVLCHDCSLAVARVLPGVFKKTTGWHSMFSDETHTSCCEFAWTYDATNDNEVEVMIGDGAGGWIPRSENQS